MAAITDGGSTASHLRALALVAAVVAAGCLSGLNDGEADEAGPARVLSPDEIPDVESTGGILKVLVTDTELFPITDAAIRISPTELVAHTDEAGTAAFGPLAEGSYSISVERKGYSSAVVETHVSANEANQVQVQLEAQALDVPYYTTNFFDAYVMCHVVLRVDGVFTLLNAPCVAVIDIVLANVGHPGGLTPDKWIYPFVIENPGFKGLILEMTWERQTFGTNGLLQLTSTGTLAAQGTGLGVGNTVYGDEQAAPFWAKLLAGHNYPPWEDDFYPEPNKTENFKLLIAGGGGNTTLFGSAVFVEFRPTLILSQFYNRAPTDEFSALPDE